MVIVPLRREWKHLILCLLRPVDSKAPMSIESAPPIQWNASALSPRPHVKMSNNSFKKKISLQIFSIYVYKLIKHVKEHAVNKQNNERR